MATKKTDTIAGKRIQLGTGHSVTIEAVRGRKVTIVAQAPDGEHIRVVSVPQPRTPRPEEQSAETA